jgi:hypothetical protein
MHVLLGPQDCGKSTFIEDYALQQNRGASVCYIDCCMTDITTPERFAEALAQQALPALIRSIDWAHWEHFKEPVAAVAENFKLKWPTSDGDEAFVQLADQLQYIDLHELSLESNMQVVYQAYYSLLAAWCEARKKDSNLKCPVLIIDEANVLLETWSGKYEAESRTLLWFLVSTSVLTSMHTINMVSGDLTCGYSAVC